MTEVMRPQLGSYMSIECFRYLRFGAEDTAGRAVVVMAGKQRGHSLSDKLKDLKPGDAALTAATLAKILGAEGTRLCLVQSIKPTAEGYEVRITESACSAGLQSEEPICAYTLGVFIGALEVITGKRISGQEAECSAQGHLHCVYQLTIL